jgi:hypothetical protein
MPVPTTAGNQYVSRALGAGRKGQVRGYVPLVLDMQLLGVGAQAHVILGEGRIARHVIRPQVIVGGAIFARILS